MKLKEAIETLDKRLLNMGNPPIKEWETIKQALIELEETNTFLECLEAAGVDNWEGYDEARVMFREGQ